VIDNRVDEAIAGYAGRIDVILHSDGSLSAADDGRGMPTDIHPEEGITGVEVILLKLHAGAKFSNKDYQFSGGLHGVGVSVVNALSSRLEVEINGTGRNTLSGLPMGKSSRNWKSPAPSASATPAHLSASGPTRPISTRPAFPSGGCATPCGPKRCCARGSR
jgi:topoisomerase-4 subunit B